MPSLDYQSSQPSAHWRIVCTCQGNEPVFAARPLGFQNTGHGAGLLMLASMGLFSGWFGVFALLFPGRQDTARDPSALPHPWSLLLLLAMAIVGLAVAVFTAYVAYSSTLVTVTRDSLRVCRRGPFLGSRARSWPLASIRHFDVRELPNNDVDGSEPWGIRRLEIYLSERRRPVTCLTGYGKEELAWLARALNSRLSQDRARQPIALKRVDGLNTGKVE